MRRLGFLYRAVRFYCLLGVVIAPGIMPAAQVIYNFDNVFSGSSDSDPTPWEKATISDVSPGTVSLTVTNTDFTGSEFISGLYLNINPADDVNNLVFHFVSQHGSFTDPTINLGEDNFKADGDGYYDILLSFGTANGTTFAVGDSITYTISGIAGLTALDFAYISSPGGGNGPFYAAAHLQSMAGGASAWINPSHLVTIVAEPGPVAMVGFLGGFAFLLRSVWRRLTARA